MLLFTILVRLSGLIHPPAAAAIASSTPFASMVLQWLNSIVFFDSQNQVLAILILFAQGLMINYISASHQILYKDSVMPGLFYILLNSLYPAQMQLTPELLASTFVILLLYRLCYLYESSAPLLLVFDGGMLLGFGILLDTDVIIYLPFILISVLYMTSTNIRYWLVAILGMLVPVYFLSGLFYLSGSGREMLIALKSMLGKNYINAPDISLREAFVWFFILPILVFSAIQLQLNFYRNKVKTRRIQLIILVMFVFGVVSVLAGNHGYTYSVCYLSVPLGYLMANYFVRSSWKWVKESLFLVILGCLVYYQYFMN